jgi:hypothetical protein
LTIANNTLGKRTLDVDMTADRLNMLDGKAKDQFDVDPSSRSRRLYTFQPNVVEGEAKLFFEARSDVFSADKIEKKIKVVPEGFPFVGSRSDVLEGIAKHAIDLPHPKDIVKGTLAMKVQVYPSTLADLQQGLEHLLREPHGCFEQTSTSNYPNLLILDYLKESGLSKPQIEQRAKALLDRGYQKLTSFECLNSSKNVREGYEWFGGTAPAHEALTAYGLMQFRDMARVHEVDSTMVERTRKYLMARKDGRGGFLRNPKALDTFGRAPDHVTNAYIVWALTESSPDDDVSKELDALTEQAKSSKDPYFLALVALSQLNRGKHTEAMANLKKLVEAQSKDGFLTAEQTSITGSGGRDLQIETTALAVLGWIKANRPEFIPPTQAAVKWIGQQRGGHGGFGSTQSTILTLKALIAYAKANKKTLEDGELSLAVNGKVVQTLSFKGDARETLELVVPDPTVNLVAGKNDVELRVTGKSTFPYTIAWSYQALTPVSADQCAVRIETRLAKTELDEGDTTQLLVTVANVSGKGHGMATAIVGLPAGMTLPESMEQLKTLTKPREDGTPSPLSFWELRGRELVLYWRDLAPDRKIELTLDLVARVPGEYRGPASRAYLYYNADHKHWVEPLQVKIAPKQQ